MAGVDFLPSDRSAARPRASLGERITRARESLGLTTAQLARRLGVKTRTLADWEADRSEPRTNRLVMLAGMLGVSPTWLMVGLGDGPAGEAAQAEIAVLRRELEHARTAIRQLETIVEAVDARLARLAPPES